MMKSICLLLPALAVFASARGADDPSYFGIFAETRVNRMMGVKMKAMPKLPPGIKLPASVAAMLPGPPKRVLTVRLWSPLIAPDSATASLAPPAGLMLGDKLNLDLFRPQPAAPTGGGGGAAGNSDSSKKPPDFTIKIYWGSSATVQPGQPKVFNLASLTPGQQMEMAKHMRVTPGGDGGGGGGSYYYKDGWTTGYWPTQSEAGEIPDGASLSGTFSLSTSYAGNVTIDAPSGVDFLAPIEMTSPDLGSKIDFNGPIAFQWNPISNAIGQFASAFGMEGKNTLILWSSSEVYVEQLMADMGYLQMAEVRDSVDKKLFMPGSSTSMTIPTGIFKDADFSMLSMVAYGPGSARESVSPVPRIQTKSVLSLMLGGKKGPRDGG